ncbi:L-arabinose-responsive transcription regulator ARA1 [Lasiodiplodia hormozganensis]|uniref:L-arabinose-responsive transcription regulator ARA1 n=1 Tax=Lasiodiplodia hormozganensis TaxID=869390 RepID=A0AA39YVA1_9PEZI|nr:L-arabinose-responsive transcription regulator ARA1 [Lasiodiplodia hormozganensis]
MPRPKKDGAPEPKRRSRNGCWPCKARKVKCGEEKPRCLNCERQGETCDYSIRLNWGGRSKRSRDDFAASVLPFDAHHSTALPVDPRIQPRDYPSPLPDFASGSPMLPPLRMHPPASPPATTSAEHRTKRVRLSPTDASPGTQSAASGPPDAPSPYSIAPATPYGSFVGTPLTPGSSVASEESALKPGSRALTAPYQPSPDPRRLSVNDLLIDDASSAREQTPHYPASDAKSGTTTYGYDIGQPDLDTPRNDDGAAIALFSPPVSYCGPNYFSSDGSDESQGRQKSIAFEANGYYAKPVPIKIPKAFEPLPSLLLENPMNLLYFHHFLNHTARILVPHDCEQNPFRNILPQLAVTDDDLLGLLLAFSASHRARLLCHPEPANRIAVWVQDVFPRLRRALDSAEQISDSNLCTAIMLASLEVISPNAFEVPISWQSHLKLARQMIIARGGLRSLNRKDKVAYFLSRWFAYLDVVGSLSGSKNDTPLNSGYLAVGEEEAIRDGQIDCLLGFTNRFVGCLARIAELAKRCEPLRIDEASGSVREGWQPPEDVVAAAEQLRIDLRNGCEKVVYKGCTHGDRSAADSPPEEVKELPWDEAEIYATNEAFHWAGLLHLLRRVLGRPPSDPEVRNAVREIFNALERVRPDGSAGACLLFPMFSAGCDAQEEGQRERILERLNAVEGFGMSQVQRARELVERVWSSGRPWECEVRGEFFG